MAPPRQPRFQAPRPTGQHALHVDGAILRVPYEPGGPRSPTPSPDRPAGDGLARATRDPLAASLPPSPPGPPPRSSRRSLGGIRSAARAAGPRGDAPAPRPVPSGPHPPPECPVPRLPPRLPPSAPPRRAARATVPGHCRGPNSGEPPCPPFGPSARARVPTSRPAADVCLPVSGALSPLSPCHGCRTAVCRPRFPPGFPDGATGSCIRNLRRGRHAALSGVRP